MKRFMAGLGLCLAVSAACAESDRQFQAPLWGGDTPRLDYSYIQGAYFKSDEAKFGNDVVEYDHNSASGQILLHENIIARGLYLRQPIRLKGSEGNFSYENDSVSTLGEMTLMGRVPLAQNRWVGFDALLGLGYSRSAGGLGKSSDVSVVGSGASFTADIGGDYISKGYVGEAGIRTDFGTDFLDATVMYRYVDGDDDWSESGIRTELGMKLAFWNLTTGYAGWFQRDEPEESIASVNRHGVFLRYSF